MRYKQGCAYTAEAYKNDAAYFKDVAKAYQGELKTLYDAGLRNVQFDDPGLACEWTFSLSGSFDLRKCRFLLQGVQRRLEKRF